MTPEQRLDRLERIAMLFVSAGLRARTNIRKHEEMLREHRESVREQDAKIDILIDAQIRNEALFNHRFARNEERFAKNEERFERTEEAIERLVASQTRTDQKLQALIDTIREKDHGLFG